MSAGAIIVAREKRIAKDLLERGATSPSSAQPFDGHRGQAFKILVRHQIVRSVAGDRFYLDVEAWDALNERRRRIVFLLAALVLIGLALAMLFGR